MAQCQLLQAVSCHSGSHRALAPDSDISDREMHTDTLHLFEEIVIFIYVINDHVSTSVIPLDHVPPSSSR